MPIVAFASPLIISYALFYLNTILLYGYTKPYTGAGRVNKLDAAYLNRIGNDIKVIYHSYIMDKNVIYFVPLVLFLLIGLFGMRKNSLVFRSSLLGCLAFCISLGYFSNGGFEMIFYYVFIFSILNIAFMVNSKTNKSILVVISSYLILLLFANIYYDIKKYEPMNSSLEKELRILIPENATVMGPTEFWMFVPKAQFKSITYRWRTAIDLQQLPSQIDYFLMFSKDKANLYQKYNIITQAFKQYSGSKIIYETDSKNYGKIELYSLNKSE
jgi:hypothetical protein